MAFFGDLFKQYRSKFFDFYEGLSPQKRAAFEYLVIGIISLAVAFGIFQGYRKIGDVQERLHERYTLSKEILDALGSYNARSDYVELLKVRLSQTKSDFQIISFLERNATKAKIGKNAIDRIDPKELPPGEVVRVTDVQIQFLKVTLGQLVDFLYYIESAPYPLATRELRIVTRFDTKDFLDASLVVSLAQPKGEVKK